MSDGSAGIGARLRLAAMFAVAAVCVAFVLSGIDPEQAADALAAVRWELLPVIGGALLLVHLVRSWRFGLLVGAGTPFRRNVAVCAIGFLAVAAFPLRLGELVRPYLLTRDGVPLGRSVAGVVLERILDLLALLALLLWVSFGVDLPLGDIRVGGVDVVGAAREAVAAVLAAGCLGIVALVGLRGALVPRLARLPWVGPRAGRMLDTFGSAAADLAVRPAVGALALLGTAVAWGLTVVVVWLALWAFPGLPHGLATAGVVWTVTIAGVTAVPTPGGFGAWEVFCMSALLLWSVPASLGSTFAIFLHLAQLGFTAALGVPYLIREGVGLGRLVRASRGLD